MGVLVCIDRFSFRDHHLADNVAGIHIQKLIGSPRLVNDPSLVKVMLFLRIFPHDTLQLLGFPCLANINRIFCINNSDIRQIVGYHKLTVTLIQHRRIGAFIHDLISFVSPDPGER